MAKKDKRYYFSTIGYGIFTLMGEKYRMGRIEMFDTHNDTGFATDEFFYCVPHDISEKFEDFFDDLETDLPFHVEMWPMDDCRKACAEALGCTIEQLSDKDYIEKYYKDKYKDE